MIAERVLMALLLGGVAVGCVLVLYPFFSALLWAALDSSANALQGVGVARELVTIMQGVMVLSVVVAYEFVRRYRLVLEARDVARALAVQTPEAVAA